MARKPLTVTIGTGEFTAICPVPHDRIGFLEAVALTCRGWWDAGVNRIVPDTAPTHTMRGIQSRHRKLEVEAVRRIDGALSTVDRELAIARAIGRTPVPDAAREPTHAELHELARDGRAGWADRVRSARLSAVMAEAARADRDRAECRQDELRAALRALVVEGDDVRRLWREAYEMRAARYTRSRFGRRGARMTAAPAIASYPHAEGPTSDRVGGGAIMPMR